MSTAVVVGATGLIGSHCLRLLIAAADYRRVLVFARRPTGLQSPKLDERIIDFEHLPELAVLPVGDVFCALGAILKQAGSWAAFRRVDYDYVLYTAQWAVRAGASQFLLVSSVGASRRSLIRYTRLKGQIEDAVCALPFRSVHIFRPSFLLGPHTVARPRDEAMLKVALPLERMYFGPLLRWHSIGGDRVAAAMLGAALKAEPGVHIYHYQEMLALADEALRLKCL